MVPYYKRQTARCLEATRSQNCHENRARCRPAKIRFRFVAGDLFVFLFVLLRFKSPNAANAAVNPAKRSMTRRTRRVIFIRFVILTVIPFNVIYIRLL
jgi:hypothetical protein